MAKPTKGRYRYDYPRPMVTVDVVIVSRDKPRRVLLIRRKQKPFAGKWAIPGGYVEMDEPLEAAARRELFEETGVPARRLQQLHTFGDPGRDPRGRTISVAFLAVVDAKRVKPRADDDAADVSWHSLRAPPDLAFDHDQVLGHVRQRLKRGP